MEKKSEQKSVVNKRLTKQEEEKMIRNYRIKENIYHVRIVLAFITIFLELLALFGLISFLYGLIPFVINLIIKYNFEKND